MSCSIDSAKTPSQKQGSLKDTVFPFEIWFFPPKEMDTTIEKANGALDQASLGRLQESRAAADLQHHARRKGRGRLRRAHAGPLEVGGKPGPVLLRFLAPSYMPTFTGSFFGEGSPAEKRGPS